tara:strand:- start:2451 stop:2690 length:240 start_codon:yes stop_codon:yes gene_type:complete
LQDYGNDDCSYADAESSFGHRSLAARHGREYHGRTSRRGPRTGGQWLRREHETGDGGQLLAFGDDDGRELDGESREHGK